MPWAAAIAAAGAIGGSLISSNASSSAANTQASAENQASQVEQNMFNTTQSNLAPYLGAGTNSLQSLMAALGISPGSTGINGVNNGALTTPFSIGNYQQSPGYQFQMNQGTNAILNNASATGGVKSGNTMKALTQFGQGLANNDYQQAYNNYTGQQNTLYNQLFGIAGSGQNAGANLGSLGTQVGSQIGSNIVGAGNAQSAGTVAGANSTNNGLNSLFTNSAFLNAINQSFGGNNNGLGYVGVTPNQITGQY